MRQIQFRVPIYEWNVTVITLYGRKDIKTISEFMKVKDFSPEEIKNTTDELIRDSVGGGRAYTSYDKKEAIIIIFPYENDASFYSTLNHEKRHLIDDILEFHGINDKEAAAYLDGFVSTIIFNNLGKLT